MKAKSYPVYIEVLRDNTVESIRKSLQHLKNDRIENHYWPSEIHVIERIMERFDELLPLWEELNSKLDFNARYDFIDCVLGLIIFARKEGFVQARQIARELKTLNIEIAEAANHLAELLELQKGKSEDSGFSSDNHYSILDFMDDAANKAGNHLYEWHPKEKLNRLFGQYDLKYWPSLPQIIRSIADNAGHAEVYASDEITLVGTQSQRASSVDCVRAFYTALGNFSVHDYQMIEKVMSFPNSAVVSLLNIVYDWQDEEILSDEQLKTYKSRIRSEL
ncbi:hypothetical protein [Pseudidiomarina aestuarii]|uniref:hypothetical protein n=1 Tax=Pseudidiomarina aestuarii TaxID=624146 RepID=UPI003A976CC2